MKSAPRVARWLVTAAVVGLSLLGCDAVPDLHVAEEDGAAGDGARAVDADPPEAATSTDAGTSHPDAGCGSVACPACPPAGGACCPNDVACIGDGCAYSCAACGQCMAGQVCCLKQNGKPMPPSCHPAGDKCN